jgi:serine protease inhibitor
MASFGAGSAAPMKNDTLDVKLNQPFIYIIRDINGTPIFVGHVDNPTIQ